MTKDASSDTLKSSLLEGKSNRFANRNKSVCVANNPKYTEAVSKFGRAINSKAYQAFEHKEN